MFITQRIIHKAIRKYKDPTKFIKKLHKDGYIYSIVESYILFVNAKEAENISGDFAEVGVSSGQSATIICDAKGSKTLHLFDTFEGLPKPAETDIYLDFVGKGNYIPYKEGAYKSSLENTKRNLRKYKKLHFYRGLFPETAKNVIGTRFSFVHIDVDLYRSTSDCLKFFYPRLNAGGRLLTHDYNSIGVQKAFNEFFLDKIEPVIPISNSQCLVVKI